MTTPRLMRRLMLKAGYAPVDVALEAPQVVNLEPTQEPAPEPKPKGKAKAAPVVEADAPEAAAEEA